MRKIESKEDKENRRGSESNNSNTHENKIIKKDLFKKINLSKLQFANTFSQPKKEEKKDKRLRKKDNSNQRLTSENESKPNRGRGYINSSMNNEYNISEERNYSHEVRKNEKWLKNRIVGKLNLGKNFQQ